MLEPLEPRAIEATVERFDPGGWPDTRLRQSKHEPDSARDLDEADVVVCVGSEVEELPRLPDGVALGGTRAACERGLLPRSRQIGLLGRQVAPRLLVAVVKANVVAAVSADRSAPMVSAADVAVTGDWREILPALLNSI